MNISQRIEELINLCPKADIYADVGCDHGYVAVSLIVKKIAKKVYATDISLPSLQKTKDLCNKHNVQESIECFCCDGLESLQNKTLDVCVIAGIGGHEMIKIIKNSNRVKTLVLQPMRNVCEVRTFLNQNGYKIEKDYVKKEHNKFYNFILAVEGNEKLSEDEILFGKTNLQHFSQDFIEYLLSEKQKKSLILSRNNNKSTYSYLQKIENILNYK